MPRYCPDCNGPYPTVTGVCVNHPEPVPVALVTGTQVQGNGDTYTLDYLGAGAMGITYKATNSAGQTVVVKELLPVNDPAKHAENLRRFTREADIQMRLSNAYSGQVPFPRGMGHFTYDIPDPTGPVTRDFMVMEFIPGQSLGKMLKTSGTLAKLAALQFIIELCEALKLMHNFVDPATRAKSPIVHRDMKPDNVMVVALPSGGTTYKLLDFGIARSAIKSAATQAKGVQGTIAGSAPYWAPEQLGAIGGNIDGRTDIYALGATVYELATGKLFDKAIATRLPEVTANVSDADLQGIIKKAIQVQPAGRYQTVEEMRDAAVTVYESQRQLPQHLRHLSLVPVPAPPPLPRPNPVTPAPTPQPAPVILPAPAPQTRVPRPQIKWHNGGSVFTGAGRVEYHQDCGGQVGEISGWLGHRFLTPLPGLQVIVARIHDLNSPSPGAITNTTSDSNGHFDLEWDDTTVPSTVPYRRLDIHVKDQAGNLLSTDSVIIKKPNLAKRAGRVAQSRVSQFAANASAWFSGLPVLKWLGWIILLAMVVLLFLGLKTGIKTFGFLAILGGPFALCAIRYFASTPRRFLPKFGMALFGGLIFTWLLFSFLGTPRPLTPTPASASDNSGAATQPAPPPPPPESKPATRRHHGRS